MCVSFKTRLLIVMIIKLTALFTIRPVYVNEDIFYDWSLPATREQTEGGGWRQMYNGGYPFNMVY